MNKLIEQDIKAIINGVGDDIKKLECKEIFITGGSGFLGSWFVAVFDYLNDNMFKKPCTVFSMDSGIACDGSNAIVEKLSKNILFRQDDISTAKISGSVNYIIHAAGIASPVYYRKFPIETIDGMVLGLSNLLKFSVRNKIEGMLYFSSSEMYGNPRPENVPTGEDYNGNVSCTGPRSCYDESKRMGETMCVAYHKIHGVPVNWVRPFNVYGPGMRKTDDRVVPKFIYQMLQDKDITVHSPGIQTRTFCYITDAITGFLKAMLHEKKGEVYNIGNDYPELSVNQLAIMMKNLFHTDSKIIEVEMPEEYPRDQAQRRCPDLEKARVMLRYDPRVKIDDGLSRTWEWCVDKVE